MFGKTKIAALVAEFLGTGILTLMILSAIGSQLAYAFFITATAGLTLALLVFAFGKASGGHFNPAITLGFLAVRRITLPKAVLYVAVQLLGAWAAYGLYTYYIKTDVPELATKFDWHVFVAEAVGAAIFAFTVAAAVYQGVSRAAAASFAGLGLMIGATASSAALAYGALGFLNPAVALGARAWVLGSFVAGPILGAIIGMLLYDLLFADDKEKQPPLKFAPAVASVGAKSTTKKSASGAKKKPSRSRK